MKKLTLIVFAALTGVALAGPTYSYWAAAYTEAATADTSGGTAVSSYSGYYCAVETAETLFGGSTVAYLTDYLTKNYEAGVAALKTESAKYPGAGAAGQLGRSLIEYDHGQYALNSTYGDSLATFGSAYLAVLLYSDTNHSQFLVMSSDTEELESGNAYFNDDGFSSSGTSSGWMTVPEPTSGLLMLLGLAGLALRRRHA